MFFSLGSCFTFLKLKGRTLCPIRLISFTIIANKLNASSRPQPERTTPFHDSIRRMSTVLLQALVRMTAFSLITNHGLDLVSSLRFQISSKHPPPRLLCLQVTNAAFDGLICPPTMAAAVLRGLMVQRPQRTNITRGLGLLRMQ